jgi:hypothetical protein
VRHLLPRQLRVYAHVRAHTHAISEAKRCAGLLACAHQLTHSCRAHSHCVVCEMPVECQNRWTLTRTTRARRSRVDASDCLDLLLPQSISVFAFDFSGSSPHPQTLKDTQSLPHAIPVYALYATACCIQPLTRHPVSRTCKHSKTREGLRGRDCLTYMRGLYAKVTHPSATHALDARMRVRMMIEENRRM